MLDTYGLTRVVAPTAEPVTLAEAKAWVQQDHAADDALISGLITAGRSLIEQQTGLVFLPATYRLVADQFPCWTLRLPRYPLRSVSSIEYIDSAGDLQTLDSSSYLVDTDSTPGLIEPAYGEAWPTARYQARAVRITFEAGYSLASDVPEPLKQAIKMLVALGYAQRGDLPVTLPDFVGHLITPYLDGGYC